MNKEEIKIIHAIPGRVRLKISMMKRNPALGGEIKERLTAIKGIQHVEVNPVIGSLLLLYDAKEIVSPDSLWALSEFFTCFFPDVNPNEFKEWLIAILTQS